MEILLDGETVEIREGTRLGDILPERDKQCCIAVIRLAEAASEKTSHFRMVTDAGDLVVEITDPSFLPLLESPAVGETLKNHWSDRYAAAFGPFRTDIVPARKTQRYDRGDVILGCGGYDAARSYLLFSRMTHSADHGVAEGGGVIGKIVSGLGLLDRIPQGGSIRQIQRLLSWADRSRSITTTDGEFLLEDGMRLVTRIRAVVHGYEEGGITAEVAESAEHLLLAMQDGHFIVGRSSSTHLMDERLKGVPVRFERLAPRLEGTVTVRCAGSSAGCVYLYSRNVPSNPWHTMVGRVVAGIELVKVAVEGDVLCIEITPGRFDLLGLPLDKAVQVAKSRGIDLQIDTTEGERVVVGQEPGTTLDVLAAGEARLTTEALEEVVAISLDDNAAPMTCAIFREITGLNRHATGVMPLYYKFEDVFLFKPKLPTGMNVLPENTPKEPVPPFSLGITNDSRKGAGLVGMRSGLSSEFGPTSEPFSGTTIIGRVLEPEKLDHFKEGSNIYLREVRE